MSRQAIRYIIVASAVLIVVPTIVVAAANSNWDYAIGWAVICTIGIGWTRLAERRRKGDKPELH